MYKRVSSEIVSQLAEIVGDRYVANSKAILASYLSKGIMGIEAELPEVVVRPGGVDEVRKVLQLANENKIPVTPLSGGLSGGFSLPAVKPGGILLDLTRMDSILDIDLDARYMVVEPGVTTGRVWAHFRRNHPDWAPPIPDGAPPAATVVGDALERGFTLATSLYGPQADLVLGMEVVLPSGKVLRTGSWALKKAKPFYKWGPGPDIGGLFLGAQGSMGVVTKMAIKILPHSEHKDIVAFGFDSPEDMVNASLEVLKKEVSVMAQGGNWWLVPTRLGPEEKIDLEMTKKSGVPDWFMNFELWGRDEADLNYRRNLVREVMREQRNSGVKSEEWELHPRQKASRLLKPNKIAIPYALFKGSYLFITWYTPWRDAAEFCRVAEEKMNAYGIPPVLWVAAIDNGRQAICMPIVCYDPTDDSSVEKIRAFNEETTQIFYDSGWLNYRPDPTVHAPAAARNAPEYFDLLRRIKKLLDPNGIMHPGRLGLP
ncbi:MAG: FAD-binding oxidoreductase [Aigarchaeota archaeon]|nr:FAD-binding oxidoreductase [Aigarchaeota archaeon]